MNLTAVGTFRDRVVVGPSMTGTSIVLAPRVAAVRAGYWLGWASILAVLTGLVLDVGGRHRLLLLGVTLAAAAGNGVAMIVPWREWLEARRGRLLLDAWCAGLIGFVALLVVSGGPTFSLLLFLTVPFIAVVQKGRRRILWVAIAGCACAVVAAILSLPAGTTAMRLALVGATAGAAVVLERAFRRETARAETERALAREASHRVKNDLQAAADLLLLGRPDGPDGAPFDETAARIHSIAAVHRLLAENGESVDGGALLRAIAGNLPVTVDADPGLFDAATAQKLGLVANELITNALQHGAAPVTVRLSHGRKNRLLVEDGGRGFDGSPGVGLQLVQRIVELGLHGTLDVHDARAEVVFPAARG